MQSAIISYTLTVAMLIPVSGWLADRFGTRKVFMLAVTLFTLGSLACALSTSLTELVIFRVLQGIGGAMMMRVGSGYPIGATAVLGVGGGVDSWGSRGLVMGGGSSDYFMVGGVF